MAYELRISDLSSDVCSSYLALRLSERAEARTLSGNVRSIIEEPIKFLKRPYSSMLFRNPNSLRHSRWLRKGVRRVTTDFVNRSEERSVGKESVRTCRYRR